ncbi:hypothetical protein N7476_005095 [Penicillium atrosanguineum]|uniref:Uncharacterized protein n=1 Tax=Penicillium atrosanguineum TaxID=1132637 RepID=A0A9W9Q1Z5_9EURO|nr:hypothetical protein N7476_005095 [Penicillium atrosanguineum]
MADMQQYLRNQPQPKSVLNEEIYPLVCCVWLRNFIVDSLHTLNFDRGRLLGLQLKDNVTQNVHRGFGLLWDFLEACGPKALHEDCTLGWQKDAELRWFQYHNVQPTETEHMLQIWNALKLLLLKHSAERQVQGQADRAAGNVISFMKHGLGEIQRYLANIHAMNKPFWDGSNADTFFAEACREWQDRWRLE